MRKNWVSNKMQSTGSCTQGKGARADAGPLRHATRPAAGNARAPQPPQPAPTTQPHTTRPPPTTTGRRKGGYPVVSNRPLHSVMQQRWCVQLGHYICGWCGQKRGEDTQMLTCNRCHVARFCNTDHQKMASKKTSLGWNLRTGQHKDICWVFGKWS